MRPARFAARIVSDRTTVALHRPALPIAPTRVGRTAHVASMQGGSSQWVGHLRGRTRPGGDRTRGTIRFVMRVVLHVAASLLLVACHRSSSFEDAGSDTGGSDTSTSSGTNGGGDTDSGTGSDGGSGSSEHTESSSGSDTDPVTESDSSTDTGSDEPCPEPPAVGMLGFVPFAAAEFEHPATVTAIADDVVSIEVDGGMDADFFWYGPDPGLVLSVGDPITAKRYSWEVTSAGLLDAILLEGEVALATSMNDAFTIEFPDLSVIGVTLEHAEDCVVGANPGIQRYSVTFSADLATSSEIRIGETGEAAGWRGTLVEASQYPSEEGPPEVEAHGAVYITFLRES